MSDKHENYNVISNSDYIWKCEGNNIFLKKSYPKAKRFIIRSVFFMGFFYIGFFSGMIGSKYDFPFLMRNMHIIALFLSVMSFPISGYYLKKINVFKIDTKLKIVKHTKIFWSNSYKYNSSDDFVRKSSFIGGRFQAPIETLLIKSQEDKMRNIAKIVMPDKSGFQPIINAIQTCEIKE